MYDFEIAFYLYKMARIQKIFLDSKYKAEAYYSAAMAIDAYTTYITDMYRQQRLRDIPYIGSKMEKNIIEIIETGELEELKKYESRFHINDYTLLLSSGLSDELTKKLWDMGIVSVKDLLKAGNLDRLRNTVKEREYEKLERFMQEYENIKEKYLWAYGECLGKELLEFVKSIAGVREACFHGEMTNISEKVQTVEIAIRFTGEWKFLVKQIKRFQRITDVQEMSCSEISGRTRFGIPFRLICTGNVHVSLQDIRGDLHTHTNWTDGIHSLEKMILTAEDKGYEYIAITDHSISMRMAHGLSENQALSQIREIRQIEKKCKIKVLAGIEVDILQNGELDYCDEVLCQFDFVVAAVHSHMNQSALVMRERLQKALSNPYVNILAHPTGRLLGRPGVLFSERKPFDINVLEIIDLCEQYQVALEVNCFPERLDLDAVNAQIAVQKGVKLSLGTDAHSIAHYRNIEYGARMLEAAGIDKDMVLNTYSYEELITLFKKRKATVTPVHKVDVIKSKKDFQHYFGNNPDILDGRKRIIGIDLTGNEDKESGWAYLTSEYAECRKIGTDAELIKTVTDLKPDVVSIDSPLAYPRGRCCSRKDCTCSQYGIMRESERLLRHFGITVYPCLIDSMVNLTTRGMRLAKTLRANGHTVIESYPGVAQDVLMIPRKGKTQALFIHLKQGLISFGIKGDLITNANISHDEVDAITSALVGYFYLNNQYIGMGNDDEDYLIVPRIADELLQKRMIIGLSGETSAGKTTIAEYLRFKYGLKYFRYSKVIAEKYKTQDKRELQQIGSHIAQDEQAQRALTRYMIDRMDPAHGYVIDGLRHYEDYDELKKYFGDDFIFSYVNARYTLRSKRYRKSKFNQVTEEEFRAINDHIAERDIVMLQMQADYRIDNNNGYKQLWSQVEDMIKTANGGKY